MKTIKKIFLSICTLVACLSLFGLTACKDGEDSSQSTNSGEESKTLSLNVTEKELIFGDSYELIPRYQAVDGATFSWKSENEGVATVTDGLVQSVGIGQTTVSVSYADWTASCLINVSFGSLAPTLQVEHVSNNQIVIAQGETYALEGKVLFNEKEYSCDLTVELVNDGVVAFENGAIQAKNIGTTEVCISTSWNGFSSSALKKTIAVSVVEDVSIYMTALIGDKTSVVNGLELNLVSDWSGKTFDSQATINGVVLDNGEVKSAEIEVMEDGIVSYRDGVVYAETLGETTVYARYTSASGEMYETSIPVRVVCPVEEYEGTDVLKFCTQEDFPVEAYFGKGAIILSAKQGETPLKIKRGKHIEGIVANGKETEAIEIITTKGGYVFKQLFAYTQVITAENLFSVFSLSKGKIIDGYYIMEEDITSVVDVTSQSHSWYMKDDTTNTYFCGTFDGQGHKLCVKVGLNGLFGGLADGAIIKDTHFEFTFATHDQWNNAYSTTCGLANNNATFAQSSWVVTLQNLYITTTNYNLNSYALMGFKSNNLVMQDIYVELTGVDKLPEYTDASQNRAALFGIDASSVMGSFDMYEGAFKNVQVVTQRFMPIADNTWMDKNFVCYAKNDAALLGNYVNAADASNVNFCKLLPGADNDKKLFGVVNLDGNIVQTYAWLYTCAMNIENGGINRYNQRSALESVGITSVGDWSLSGEWLR